MKEIALYTTDCPSCKVVKQQLDNEGQSYKLINDKEVIMRAASKHNLFSVPFIEYDGDVYLKHEMNALFQKIKSDKGVG